MVIVKKKRGGGHRTDYNKYVLLVALSCVDEARL